MHLRLSFPPHEGMLHVLLYPKLGGTQQSQHLLHPLGQFSLQQFASELEPQQLEFWLLHLCVEQLTRLRTPPQLHPLTLQFLPPAGSDEQIWDCVQM
jgi:hypothetical protein